MSKQTTQILLALLALALGGCGALSSGAGDPPDEPSSGLGAWTPVSDDSGLRWTPPFIFADPARAFSHPSAIVSDDAIDLWVDALRGQDHAIVHAYAAAFENGFDELGEVLSPSLPWQVGVGSPSMVWADGAQYLFYVSAGKIGLAYTNAGGRRFDPAAPLYADPRGADVASIAAARLDDGVRLVALVGDELVEATIALADLQAAAADASIAIMFSPTGIAVPSWATRFLEVGLRIEPTATGRLREDLSFSAALPTTATDLGTAAPPSAIGAASRYLADQGPMTAAYEVTAAPLMSGNPAPSGPAIVSYRGGGLLFYGAQSGPRQAVGVARHP